MLDKQFFRKNAQDIVNKYRKHIFDPAGGGARAKDVYGKNYPSTYSEPYGTNKKNKPLPRRNAKFARSNAPVLTGDLMRDFQGFDLTGDGFKFGTPTRGGVVKNLDSLGRTISSNSQPIPEKVEDFIIDLANKYVKRKLGKIKGRTFNI